MSAEQGPAIHDFGPGRRTRGVDYNVYSFDKTPTGVRFFTAGRARPGDDRIRVGDQVIISPPSYNRGCTCRVLAVTYRGDQWDAELDMARPPARPHEPGARPMPLSRLLYP
jgi:hypothetical protein